MNLPDMTESLADSLIKSGYFSADDLVRTTVEELAETARISEEAAGQFIVHAEKAAAEAARTGKTATDENAEAAVEEDPAENHDVGSKQQKNEDIG